MPSIASDNPLAIAKDVELARYRTARGERALTLQVHDGRLALLDVAADHHDHAYVVERDLGTRVELVSLAREYADRSQAFGLPAILATMRGAELS